MNGIQIRVKLILIFPEFREQESLEIKVECWMIPGSAYKKVSQISLHGTSKTEVKKPKFCTSEKWNCWCNFTVYPLGPTVM